MDTARTVASGQDDSSLNADESVDLRWLLAVAILLLPAAIMLWCGWQRRWTSDDGFINYRIVRQIVEGHGPVFNAGQRVEAGTSPLWLASLSFLDLATPIRLEWIGAISGLFSTVGAVVLAIFGTRRALVSAGVLGFFLPLGALAYVSLPPAWDYATSGLETGFALLWLAVSWWLLCGRVAPGAASRVPWYVPVVVGLGPLVRPDFLVFSVGFVVALALLSSRAEIVRIVLLAAALPFVAELLRTAYFASLVPNTAMAKEASRPNVSQGWDYLVDFGGNYKFWLPVVVLGGLCWAELRNSCDRPENATRRYVILSALVAGAAAVHALYIVYVGGDFMHARLLLPAAFAALLPVSVAVATNLATRLAAATVIVWSVFAMTVFRPPYSGDAPAGSNRPYQALDHRTGIADERLYYARTAEQDHPVTIDDYLKSPGWAQSGANFREFAARAPEPFLVLDAQADPTEVPIGRGGARRTVASLENLGLFAYAAGTDVDVIDKFGLADVVAGHVELGERGRPGHEKDLSNVWTFARYAPEDAPLPDGMTAAEVSAARRALACGALRRLVDSTDGQWSISDAPSNLLQAFRSFRFRFNNDPVIAERDVCGSAR